MADETKVRVLYALGFLDMFALSMFTPLLFDHLRSLEVSHFTIGLLGSVHSGIQLISAPIIHTQTMSGSLLAEATSPDKLSEVQGRMASIGGMAFMIGPVIGGHLGEYQSGFQYLCYMVSLALMLNFALVRFLLTNSTPQSHKKKKLPPQVAKKDTRKHKEETSTSSEIFRALTDLKNINWPLYWDIFAFKLLFDFTCGLHYQNFRIILMDLYNVSSTWVGYCMASMGLVGAATGFLNGQISKLYKKDKSYGHKAFHMSIVFALSFILSGCAPNLMVTVMSYLLLSICSSLLGVTISEIILLRTAPDQRGSILGTAQSIMSLSFLLTPISSGIVYEVYGHNGLSVLKVLTATASLLFSLFLCRNKRDDKKKK
ncbi:hypothetical protein C0J52_04942 [Blattella germanica]|nr:hypothetical protein C0J52_04942 [Blattella germanica]